MKQRNCNDFGSGTVRPALIHALIGTALLCTSAAAGEFPIHGFRSDMADPNEKYTVLDINGDGLSDVFVYRPGAGWAGVYISRGDGTLRWLEYSRPGNPGKQSRGFGGDVMDSRDRAVALDFNGDGKSDILWYRPGGGYAGVHISNGDGSLRYISLRTPSDDPFTIGVDFMDARDKLVALDIDGNGKSDILWYRPGGGGAGLLLNQSGQGVRFVAYLTSTLRAHYFEEDVADSRDTAVALDINGDGRSDFLWYRPGGGVAGVYISNENGTLTHVSYRTKEGVAKSYFPLDVLDNRDTAVPLDINGDGKSDFLWYRPGKGFAGVFISDGGGIVHYVGYRYGTAGGADYFPTDFMDTRDTMVPLDINGDKKSDFLVYRPGSGYANIYIAGVDGKVSYKGYSTPDGQANGFIGDVKSNADVAIPANISGYASSDFLWMRPGGRSASLCSPTGEDDASLNCFSYFGSTENWMGDYSDQISKVALKSIVMPGTHDSAMYNLLDIDISKNQKSDAAGQLKAGARWLDMRLTHVTKVGLISYFATGESMSCSLETSPPGDGYYMYGHSSVCSNYAVADALKQVAEFIQTHQDEIVILRLHTYVSSKTVDRTGEFTNLVRQQLKWNYGDRPSMIYDHATACALAKGTYANNRCSVGVVMPQNVTPEMLWDTPARVILTLSAENWSANEMWGFGEVSNFTGYYPLDPPSVLYGSGGIAGPPSLEISYIENGDASLVAPARLSPVTPGLTSLRPAWQPGDQQSSIMVTSAALTPFGYVGGEGCAPYCYLGPIDLAKWFNPELVDKLNSGDWDAHALNVFSVDYIDCCGVAEAIIRQNDQQWAYYPLKANDVAANRSDQVWALGGNGEPGPDYTIRLWTGVRWLDARNKRAARIAVDPQGLPWVVQASGSIWRMKASTLETLRAGNSGDDWEVLPGAATDIGIGGDGTVWVLGSGRDLYKFNGKTWDSLPAEAIKLSVDNTGRPWIIGTDDQTISYYDGKAWVSLAKGEFRTATDIAVGAENSVWVAGTDIYAAPGVWKWEGSGWKRYRNGGKSISVDSSGAPWVTRGDGIFAGFIR